jgi:hypothetical protein
MVEFIEYRQRIKKFKTEYFFQLEKNLYNYDMVKTL